MIQFRVTTERMYDGIDARIPSIRECDVWGKTEEEALEKLLERVAYFLQLPPKFKYILDTSRRENGITHYTLIIKHFIP